MDKVQENGSSSTAPASNPTLTLEALAAHDFVRINGQTYDLQDLDMLGLRDRSRVVRLGMRVGELARKGEDATDEDSVEYVTRCRELAAIALPTVPPEIFATLNGGQVETIALTFFDRARTSALFQFAQPRMGTLVEFPQATANSTSDSSLPTSAAPTEAT